MQHKSPHWGSGPTRTCSTTYHTYIYKLYIYKLYLYIIYYIAALGVGSDEDLRVGAEVAAHDGEDAAAAELVGLDGHQRHDDGRICDVNGRLHDRKCNYNCIHSCNYD